MSCRAVPCNAHCEANLRGILSGTQQFLEEFASYLRSDFQQFREMHQLFQRGEWCYHQIEGQRCSPLR